ncbi:glycosyl hydrolase 53 family protein [Aliifodinibius salicampi]|uniref:Glycosyl hydrolase 53 family protein n=1 Tax=Fodinibius salicampi TaxID=1920655 RepID=A0ABT3Q376_9BACT|nr:glycosyl hydrolase 53 family protein [Fodinibius salicampi]MCW9714554.1 glycosyl hydrolase 53 family protein [Fodinibius salicampi]
MGFSTWSYGPDQSDVDDTYQFISQNADIYSEQIDEYIPWSAWINNSSLPSEFEDIVQSKVAKKLPNQKLLLSVSLLNTDRSDLLSDYDGTIPSYNSLNDQKIEEAYFKHLDYLISELEPDYLVVAMEVNELLIKSESKWNEYKILMDNIRGRLKSAYPTLPLSESMTLHNWFNPEVPDPSAFISEISSYINQNLDYAAISFYPFFKGLRTKSDFQQPFDFLHNQTTQSIAFVETTHLAEDLTVEAFDVNIPSNACEQKDYLEELLNNAYNKNYEFVIWWAHRDYDELWATFPDEVKDIGKLWRDTGLLDEDGNQRPAYKTWKSVLNR